MAKPATPLPIPDEAQRKVCHFLQAALDQFALSYNIRTQMEQRDKAYYREGDTTTAQTRAAAANAAGDTAKMQNVTVPVVMPQVESALADLSEMFLSGYPIFPTVAPPQFQDAAEQMDTLVATQSERGGWANQLALAMRDGLKYDLGAVEVCWENKKLYTIQTAAEKDITQGKPQETYQQGNAIKRLDPYNIILDVRVAPEKNHELGEFAGYTEVISRIQLKKEMEDMSPLGTMNFRGALESPGPGGMSSVDVSAPFFVPSVNPGALLPPEMRREFNWLAYVDMDPADRKGGTIQYKNAYERTILYVRLLPIDFGIDARPRTQIQIWKFVIINRTVVIFAEQQTNAHNLLPIIVCKPSNDGMAWQSKSFAENVVPYQQVSSALVNSGIESQRRKVYDRMFYDPSRVNKKDIDVVSSVARIPVKNSMYGKTIAEAVYQVPYRDEGVSEVMQLSQNFAQMADVANGQNRVQQGQFQKGNKTRKEFDTVMGNANSRGRLRGMGLEYTFFSPIKTIVKANILQYQPPAQLLNAENGKTVDIDPVMLREAIMNFRMADGYLPVDKMVSMDVMGTLFQVAPGMPQLDVEYDLMGMFIYSMRLNGANWLKDFKRTPEQIQQRMAMMTGAATAAGNKQPPAPNNQQPPIT